MITIGVAAHKRVHQALALTDTGTVLGNCVVPLPPKAGSTSWSGPSPLLVHGCQVAPVHGTPASSVIPGARLCPLPYNGSMLDINH